VSKTDILSTNDAFGTLWQTAAANWHELMEGERPVILVGAATCGRAAGALEVAAAFRAEIAKQGISCPVLEVGCMGHCYAEPMAIIRKPGYPATCYGRLNPVIAENLVREFLIGDNPMLEFVLGAIAENDMIPSFADFPRAQFENKIVLKNCGLIDPEQIDHYIAGGGYKALSAALEKNPDDIISEIKASGLRGRGGAGFPTGDKWRLCRDADGASKYVICNADEGDPGAFMDRSILESDPHEVLEGMIIAACAIGATEGYIYIRAEYPLAVARMETALGQARQKGLLGKNILGSDFSFQVSVFQGSGAFVCGEESALIASLEGHAGLPRHRPPFPSERGLNGQPTLINNVKTLANIPHIMSNGAAWFAAIGNGNSSGTAVFALAGKVVNTGLTEVPMGTTLREVIFDVGSGVPGGRKFKAVQIGGPSGGCLPESALDMPIGFDSLQEAGAMMGSGGMVVLDEDDCMVEIARYFLEFTRRESCGKCTFCRLGTRQMLEILGDITAGKGRETDIDALRELARDIKAGSLCGLGRTAPNPVLTTLRYFIDEYEAHIKERRCPALMCLPLIEFYIEPHLCHRSCDACVGPCTVEAITANKKGIKVIDMEKCVKCGICLTSCPPEYHAVSKYSPPETSPGYKPPQTATSKEK
jgi:NADH-quinone oxidoreductase subunit F